MTDNVTVRPGLGALYSALVGAAARTTVPRALRRSAYRTFARAVGANLSEVEKPLTDYSSLGDFFARRLTPAARHLAADPAVLISPCDGLVAASGAITSDTLVQAKGRNYSLAALLCDAASAASFVGGVYSTVYLSPRDYHRVHCPFAAELVAYHYVPGALWPVSKRFVDGVDELFAVNERVVIELTTAYGAVTLVMVAAAGVGNLWLSHWDGGRETRGLRTAGQAQRIVVGKSLQRGDELGAFQLGSTVIMLAQHATLLHMPGDVVRFGEPLARQEVGHAP
jgi:phosphatidylserine decarboxylase